MKKYLWIGCSMDEKLKKHLVANNAKILSALTSQDLIFDGIENVGEIVFDSINGIRLPFFPNYKELKVKHYEWSHKDNAKDVSVGYLNLLYLGLWFKKNSLIKQAKRYIKENKNNEIQIFVYELHSPLMECANYIKKHCHNVKICQIIPDLPQFMDLSMSKIKKILKAFDWKKIKKIIKNEDKFILYASPMANFLELRDDSWLLMEGLAETELFENILKTKNDKHVLMYSGRLEEKFGIIKFLEAFNQYEDDNLEAWITGGGACEAKVKQLCEIDKRIKFYGYLENKNQLLSMQKSADVLLNLRDSNELSTKYCFPSKIMEYLLSGNIVVSNKIDGIPEQYDEYLLYLEDYSVQSIETIVNYVKNKKPEDRSEIAKKSIEFIKNNKSKEIQCKRMWDFVDK